GAAVGYQANGYNSGAAVGWLANGYDAGAAVGWSANGYTRGAAVGESALGYNQGAAMGFQANGFNSGAAVGHLAKGTNYGAAVGRQANGADYGVAMGYNADGSVTGVAVGASANGSFRGVALGYQANGAQTNVAIGAYANAQGGANQVAIGNNVTNDVPNTVRVRGSLYLDGGGSIYTNAGIFGSSDWGIKAFTIDHPLDPENKILRHFCLEGPQVWNVYAGNVQLVNGQAVVELPDYYSALNLVGSEIYALTPVGGWAPIWINNKVAGNKFVIAGQADIEVSWTIKVLRNDPGCLEDLRRRPVEQRKDEILNSRTAE
ncbi:MAG: hypothetical protein Q7J98_07220, partial [Kiritimatiellia bacterium]|nr:hypothetical protein [Kiritimatiellia bacterium]